jgi:hypothetical protein
LRSSPSQRVAIRQSGRAAAAKFIGATGATVNAVYTLCGWPRGALATQRDAKACSDRFEALRTAYDPQATQRNGVFSFVCRSAMSVREWPLGEVSRVLHDRERVVTVLDHLAPKLAGRRLMGVGIEGAPADRGIEGEPEQRLRYFVRIDVPGLVDALGEREHGV